MTRIASAGALVLALAGSRTAAGHAQVNGTATDVRDRPLPNVLVELWAGPVRSRSQVTDSTGRFSFGAAEARGATGLLARRIGFGPVQVRVSAPASGVVLRLPEAAVPLEAVSTRTAPRQPCPNRESPEARALWNAVSSRYSRALDTTAVGSRFTVYEGPAGGHGGARDSAGRFAGVYYAPQQRSQSIRQIERMGYGARVTGVNGTAEFGAWIYPLQVLPQHFVSHEFARLHTLAIAAHGDGEAVVSFCPLRGALPGRPHIEGALRVSLADTVLSEARYRFRTPAPDEHAGGEIVYSPAVGPDGRPLPLPSTELFRRLPLGRGSYYERYREYLRWDLGWRSPLGEPRIQTQRHRE